MKCRIVEEYKNDSYEKFIKDKIVQKNIGMNKIYEDIENFEYKYLVCEDNKQCIGVFPFILYKNTIANVINSLPFLGYGGISVDRDKREEAFKCITDYITDFSEKNDISLVTICTEAFEENYDLYEKYFMCDYIMKNFYQYIDLDEDVFGNMKAKFRGNLKRNIKKCTERFGVEIKESYEMNDLREWYNNVYVKRLTETNCSIYPFEVFNVILNNVKRDKIKMLYGLCDDKIVGGALYLNQGKSVDNYMRVVATDYLHTQLGTYLDYLSINYAIDNKVKYYNWQSCDEIGSSIFKYKEDWGSEVGYHYYRTKVMKDITDLKNTSLEDIKKNFKGIFVLPYDEFKK